MSNLQFYFLELIKWEDEVKISFKKIVVKAKEIYISFFNKLCLWIGKQVFWYAFFELLKQLFT